MQVEKNSYFDWISGIFTRKKQAHLSNWELGSQSNQPNDLQIDTCHFLVWRLTFIGQGKDWFAQCQDTVTEWDIGSWCGGLISQ